MKAPPAGPVALFDRRRTATLALVLLTAACAGSQSTASTPRPTAMPCPPSSGVSVGSTAAPPARGYHQMSSLGPKGGVIALGGETAPPPAGGRGLLDLWGYRSASGWVQLAPQTARTSDGPAVFDVGSNRLVILGVLDQNFQPEAQNWVYDPSSDRLARKDVGARPTLGMRDFTMVYDVESDRAILFTEEGETWAYDFDNDKWTQKAPQSSPDARAWYAITYDQGLDRVILFGGVAGHDLGDTWTYDYNTDTWRNMAPAKSPPARRYSYMAYDPTSHRTVLFAGITGSEEKPLCDTWAYDLAKNSWIPLSPGGMPSARGWHAMAFDGGIGKIVLFGGGADRHHFQNDTWLFDSITNTWSPGS